ncbi:MAG: hypothetical protein WC716_00105 [Chitinophagaceae bacterium]|jgi:hypothetical protein
MKKNYLSLLLIFLIGAACNKGTVDLSTKENILTGYTVEGIYDLTLISKSSNNLGQEKLRLNITRDSGIQEKLTLSVEGVPQNIFTTITPNKGVAPYETEIIFKLTGTPKPGKYPVKLILTGESGRTKISIINLTIPIVDLALKLNQPGDFFIYNNGPTLYVNAVSVFTFGIQEPIQLSFSNLPAGAEAVFSANNRADIFSDISFNAVNVPNGVYPVTLQAKTNSGIVESYATNLVVNDKCAPSIVGEKFSKMLRYESGVLVDSIWMDIRIFQSESQANLIEFNGYNYSPNSYNIFSFQLNCNDQTIIAAKQNAQISMVNYEGVEGKGYFNPATKEIVIDFVLANGKKTKIVIAK